MFEPDVDDRCKDDRHFPPSMMVFFESGWWICPSCGHRTRIYGPPTCKVQMSPHISNDEWFSNSSIPLYPDLLNTRGTIL